MGSVSLKKAFTFVELIITILILGILAVIAVPKFVDFSKQAIVRAEQRVMVEVLGAIRLNNAQSIANGSNQWYQDNPLNLLIQAPRGWYFRNQWYQNDVCYIFCPHSTSYAEPQYPGPGAVFAYRRSEINYPRYYPELRAGQIRVYQNHHPGTQEFSHYPDGDRDLSDWNP